jgi:hypothetical protein
MFPILTSNNALSKIQHLKLTLVSSDDDSSVLAVLNSDAVQVRIDNVGPTTMYANQVFRSCLCYVALCVGRYAQVMLEGERSMLTAKVLLSDVDVKCPEFARTPFATLIGSYHLLVAAICVRRSPVTSERTCRYSNRCMRSADPYGDERREARRADVDTALGIRRRRHTDASCVVVVDINEFAGSDRTVRERCDECARRRASRSTAHFVAAARTRQAPGPCSCSIWSGRHC